MFACKHPEGRSDGKSHEVRTAKLQERRRENTGEANGKGFRST